MRVFLELVALDDVAFLVFVKLAETDSAFEVGADLLDLVLESAERGHPAIEDLDAAADHAGVGLAVDAAVRDERASHPAPVEFENLPDLCVADDGLAGERLQQAQHRLAHLVDQFVDDRVELQVHVGCLGGFHSLGFDLHVEPENDGFGGGCEGNVGLGDRSRRGGDERALDLVRGNREDGLPDRLHGALHVALEDELELGLAAAVADHRVEVLHAVPMLRLEPDEALGFLAVSGEGLRLTLGFHLGEMVADVGKFLETDHLHGHPGVGRFHRHTAVVDERSDLTCEGATDEWRADLERAGLDDHRRGGAASGNHAGLDDGGAGSGFRVGLELEHLGLQHHQIQQVVHTLARDGGNFGELGIPTEVGGLQAVFG